MKIGQRGWRAFSPAALPQAIALALAVFAFSATADAAHVVPNTFGQGADASLGNDTGVLGTSAGGGSNAAEIRAGDTGTNRNRLGIFRFDLSAATGDRSGATLAFYETGANSRTVSVYGLNDGDAGEAWSEAAITYDTAPAIALVAGVTPSTTFDPLRTTLLGTFNTTASTTETVTFASAALDAFLAADADGRVTFYLYRDGGGAVVVRTKEFNYTGTPGAVPTLTLPNANVPEPSSLALAAVIASGGAVVRRRRWANAGQ